MIKDTLTTEKQIIASDDVVRSVMHLRDELYTHIMMGDMDTTNLKAIYWKLNSCLYKGYPSK